MVEKQNNDFIRVVYSGNISKIKKLISKGVSVHAGFGPRDCSFPLAIAVKMKNTELVKLLLDTASSSTLKDEQYCIESELMPAIDDSVNLKDYKTAELIFDSCKCIEGYTLEKLYKDKQENFVNKIITLNPEMMEYLPETSL